MSGDRMAGMGISRREGFWGDGTVDGVDIRGGDGIG